MSGTVEKIKQSNLSQHNIQLILEFKNHLMAENLSIDRLSRYMSSFNTLAPHINFKLDEPDKKDLKKLVGKINQNQIKEDKEYSVWTLAEFKKLIRKFYKFQTGEEEPAIIDFVTVNVKRNEKPKTDPDELPAPKEVKELVQTASHKRDEALIFLLWDTGGRIGEVLNLKWKDLRFGEQLTKVRFRESKTGERKVPIRESVETLKEWRREHPRSSEPDSHVFVNLRNRQRQEDKDYPQMTYSAASNRIRKISKDAGLDCKTNPHAFRKGRATYLASQGMNQAQLCEYFGWVQGSDQAATYIRMANKDLEKAVKQIQGLEQEEEEQESLEPVKCPQCQEINSSTKDYCKNCNFMLSQDKRMVEEFKKKEVKQEVKQDLFEDFMQEENLSQEEKSDMVEERLNQKMQEKGLI